MTGRVAVFLRGINVGGHRVKMARLREILAGLGFDDPRTLQASGNVVFRSPPGDAVRYGQREVHWLSRGRMSDSPVFGPTLERATRGLLHTSRRATTLRRVVDRFGD